MSKPSLYTRAFVLAALANLALHLAAVLFVHLPGFLQQLGAGEAEIGRIMGAQAVGAILAWPLAGRIMDAHGRRLVILGGCGAFMVVISLYLWIDSTGPFVYVVRALDGMAQAMWYTAIFTHGADLVPAQRRTQGLAIFGVSGMITVGLGAQIGDVILAYANYRAMFLGALGFATLGLLLCLPLRDVRLGHADAAVPPRGLLAAATQPDLRPVWLAAFIFFIALFALFSFMKTFVASRGVGSVGNFFTIYAVTAVALRVFVGWLPDRVGTKRMLGVAMSCYALGFVALAVAQTPAHALAAGLLCGAGHGYTYPVLFSLIVERARPRERGSAMAFCTAVDWLGLVTAGTVGGYVIERAGYGAAFGALALLLAAGVGLFYGIDRR